jgi:hypothetical protein
MPCKPQTKYDVIPPIWMSPFELALIIIPLLVSFGLGVIVGALI